MFFLLGQPALPSFRLDRLAADISERAGRSLSLRCRDLILIDCERPPAGLELERLEALLSASPWQPECAGPDDLFVLPRPGTRTPWATKAGDILKRCGLERFAAVERAMRVEVKGLGEGELSRSAVECLHDRMTQVVQPASADLAPWFRHPEPAPLAIIELGQDPARSLARVNGELGLALSPGEIDYLCRAYAEIGRDPTDAELMMFAQANSEHCRHKIFNATWEVDGQAREPSLFKLIRHTHAATPQGTLVAYDDNAAIIEGFPGTALLCPADDPTYCLADRTIHAQIKVETHNHPTAISPDPGAATGSGGEIRDESATGRGARPVAALTGFSVSDLRIPGHEQPWETAPPEPDRLASACQIMLEGPIGAARFNNEFGRPALLGYFRSFCAQTGDRLWGYHKPIMIAGGSGMIMDGQTTKLMLSPGDRIVVLGGPAMLIGLGGGAASSMSSGQSDADLDYASVQRGNPEMQRRCQEVIDRCWGQGEANPIKSIHDVGAGGLSNAIPELLHDGGVGGQLDLRAIPSADRGLSPMEIWCNESQERYVMAIAPQDMARFAALCERERCPYGDVGAATAEQRLVLHDSLKDERVVDMDLGTLLGRPPSMHRQAETLPVPVRDQGLSGVDPNEVLDRLLALPTVGSKQFLITIGDRSVGGLSVRDQMVGPWQVPVADCAITLTDYEHYTGTAMAMGERTPLAIHDAAAASRVAVGEVLTNLAGVALAGLERIKLSANWMAAAGAPGQDAALRSAVESVSAFCQALDLSIPVGKDSLSMQTVWQDDGREQRMLAPVSLIVSGFSPVPDVRRHVTPMLDTASGDSVVLLVELGPKRLGGSALAQVLGRDLGEVPDVDSPERLRALFECTQALLADDRLLAVHDRSDGGALVAALEMALASRCGLDLVLDEESFLASLACEEIGLLIQVRARDEASVRERYAQADPGLLVKRLGQPRADDRFVVRSGTATCIDRPMGELAQAWSQTSWRMQRLRDHPDCADEEYAAVGDWRRPGLQPQLTFDPARAPAFNTGARPRVAILREQGVNGQREMARAFMAAGFDAVDVHMSDLGEGRVVLSDFHGLAACGGFSFGDVLGAGQGWARSILFNPALAEQFQAFFADSGRFALGVCNGCQMLSALKDIIPGTAHWPRFVHNRSRQFEARLSMVEILPSASLLFADMTGSRLPVVTAHGEGRADFGTLDAGQAPVCVRYVDRHGQPAGHYPDNPNGSPQGITGLCNDDGRVTILMPHPERLLRAVNYSWAPAEWGEYSPWMRLFQNARAWLD
ncbi:MAG: phosphoribosylformylglycinamidine synthase [Wenzhouxiangella sp.]|nr:MAG: phosphoribosylformylglycinamidine synthase [Wenzhouxiangella sp.]